MPWRYAFWASMIGSFALVIISSGYPVIAPVNDGTRLAQNHLWDLTAGVFGVWVGLMGGQATN